MWGDTIQRVCIWKGQAIVLGVPASHEDLPPDHPAQHDCDLMGCGMYHVLARVPFDTDGPRFRELDGHSDPTPESQVK